MRSELVAALVVTLICLVVYFVVAITVAGCVPFFVLSQP